MSDDVPLARLRASLTALTASGTLQPEQADAVLAEVRRRSPSSPPRSPKPSTTWQAALAEVGGYVGGIFVFAAALVIGGAAWDSVGRGTQIAVLAVVGLVLVAIAVTVAGRARFRFLPGARGRLASVLTVLGAASLAGASGVAGDNTWDQTLASVTGLVVAGAGYLLWRGPVLHLGFVIALAATALAVTAQIDGGTGGAGFALVLVAAVWAAGVATVLRERTTGVLSAGVVGFAGGETWAIDGSALVTAAGYLVMAVVAVVALGLYLRVRLTALVVVGVVAAGILVPQVVIDYSDGALGAGGALLVVGLSIVGASVLGLRLRSAADDDWPRPSPVRAGARRRCRSGGRSRGRR